MPDPYRNMKFEVEISGFVRAGFSKVTGLKRTTSAIEYREGGENETPHQIPGATNWDDIVLERGCSTDDDFNTWAKELFSKANNEGNQGENDSFRRRLTIYLKDKSGARVKRFVVYAAWPTEYEVGDLDGTGDEVLITRLALKHEGWEEENLAA